MGGLSVGVIWGSLVSAVGLAALSLSSPLPPRDVGAVIETAVEAAVEEAAVPDVEAVAEVAQEPAPVEEIVAEEIAAEVNAAEETATEQTAAVQTASPATEIPLPSGTEFNRPPPEPEAALPATDAAPSATAPQALALAGDVTAPSFDTAPAALPTVSAQGPAPLTAIAGDATAPTSPGASIAPSIAAGPVALTQPDTETSPPVRTALLPQITAEPENVAAPQVDPQAVPLQTPVFPNIGDAGADRAVETPNVPSDIATEGAVEAPVEEVPVVEEAVVVEEAATPAAPQTSGLPQVTVEASVEEGVASENTAPENTAPEDGALPAIRAFAAPFDESEDRPLMAVILIDEPDSRIEISTLTRFSFPVAFAIDPLHPDAAERAAAYREAGFEVVILGSMIPEGATAVDFEVALSAALVTLPEAVAMIDTPEGRIQGDRPILNATVSALADSGHGLLAFPRGLNAAEQSAARAGVPGATLFRLLDDEEQRATVITRFLTRAAFTATQEGTVIVAGHTRPDTVTALFSWALGGRSEAVAVAPLSATLLRASAP